jgi:hypothetical protein
LAYKRSLQRSFSSTKGRMVGTRLLRIFVIVPVTITSGCYGLSPSTSSLIPGGSSPPSSPAVAAAVHPLKCVGERGYFEDPLPIRRLGMAGSHLPPIAGTTHQILSCMTLATGCYIPSTLTIVIGMPLASHLPANTTLNGYQNNNVHQDNTGDWQMATTVTVNSPSVNPNGFSVERASYDPSVPLTAATFNPKL